MEEVYDKPELELLKLLIDQQKQLLEKQDKFLHNQERIIAWLKLSNKQPIGIIPKELFK